MSVSVRNSIDGYMHEAMRQKGYFVVLVLLWVFGMVCAYPQEVPQVKWSNLPAGVQVIDATPTSLTITIDVSSIRLMKVKTAAGEFLRIHHPGLIPDYRKGEPELPRLYKLIEIPQNSKVIIDQCTFQEKEINLTALGQHARIYPNQPSVAKGSTPETQPFFYHQKTYTQDSYLQDSLITISSAGTLRGRQLARIAISPFSYNPAKNSLIVKDHITLSLHFAGGNLAKTTWLHKSLSTPAFEKTFEKSLLNYSSEPTKGVATPPLKMVILTNNIFRNSLDAFIRWKRQKGIEVVTAYLGDPGVGSTVEEIKTYLSDLYHNATPENPAPSYLLIVGDVDQVPASSTAGQYTDLYYATYDGDTDYVPDIYFGRFSARDSAELVPILRKNLEYEKYLFPDPSFLGESVMIAGVDGAYAEVWGNGQINYGTGYYFNTDHGILSHTYLYPESGSSDAQIISDISNGVGFVNYTGHGYSDRWEDPRFSIADIDGLQNKDKYPLMIGNGCVTATYGLPECFAEALTRASDKGALSYIGCSNDSYWDEDYYWAVGVGPIVEQPSYEDTGLGMYDRLFHDHGEPDEDWYINQSQMVFAGNLAVMTGVPSRAKYYWEIYQLLGDPSLMVYLSVPDTLPVNTPTSLPLGLSNLPVVTEDHTVISLTHNDTILATAISNEAGLALLNFEPLADTGYIRIVGTRQNRIPYIDSIRVIPNTAPYLFIDGALVNDSLSNDNGLAESGESFYLTLNIHNLGLTDANHVTGTLATTSDLVTLSDNTLDEIPLFPAQYDTTMYRAFRITVHDSIPDGQIATFTVTLHDQNDSIWTSYLTLTLHAPDLVPGNLTVNDQEKGNGNLRLEPGETAKVNLSITNEGSASSDTILILVTMPDTLVSFYDDTLSAASLSPGAETSVQISLTLDSSIPYGTALPITMNIVSGEYQTEKAYVVPVGLSYDDFEFGNFNTLPWKNDADHPWIITEEAPYEGIFSALSGAISDNQSSALSINVNVFQDDSIHFYARVSSEKDYDYLRFLVDDNELDKWSGEQPWSLKSFALSQGEHTLTWKYTKDGSVSQGYDKAWIDYVVFPTFSFSSVDASPIEILSPKSGTALTDTVPLTVAVRNLGEVMLENIPVGYRLDNGATVKDTIRDSLNPGDTVTFTFSQRLNLVWLKTYHLQVFTSLQDDQVPVNDTLEVSVSHVGIIDVSVDTLLSPQPDSVYTSAETIGVRIINLSSGSIGDIPLTYVINNGVPVTEVAGTELKPGDTLQYFFQQQADMADTGSYEIVLYSHMPEDIAQSNDTFRITLYNNSSSLTPLFLTSSINLYPNPVAEKLTLELFLSSPAILKVQIIDLSGKIWFQDKLNTQVGNIRYNLPVTQLPEGYYHLVLSVPSAKKSLPFIRIKQ